MLQWNTGIYNQLMLNNTKQYMNKILSGRTYEKTGYMSQLVLFMLCYKCETTK